MRTTTSRRSTRTARGAVLAVLTGAGLLLAPAAAQASAPGGPAVAAPVAPVAAPNGAAQTIVDTALAQLGDAYVWAGSGPDVFDCSGLTQYAAAAAGISLPHSSRMQSQLGQYVDRSALQPGDLIFFYEPVGHVGIYLGEGKMVHAPTSGDVVRIAEVDAVWGYHSARRIA